MGDYGDQLRIGKGDDVQVQGQGVHPHTPRRTVVAMS